MSNLTTRVLRRPASAIFTSGHADRKLQKRATLSHFCSGARHLSARRARSTSPYSVLISDIGVPFGRVEKPRGARAPETAREIRPMFTGSR